MGVYSFFAARAAGAPPGAGRGRGGRPRLQPPRDAPRSVRVTGKLAWEGDDLELLEALHGAARGAGGEGVRLVLPRFGGDDDPVGPIADALERRWASLDDAPEIEWQPAAAPAVAEVVDAPSLDAEARAAVCAVVSAIAAGAAPERVAIVVPDLDEEALEPLRAALAEAGLPFAEPRGRPIERSPEARAALALLAVATGPVTRDDLIELLRAPGVHTGWWTERNAEGEAAERAAALGRRLRDLPVGVARDGALFVDALRAEVVGRASEAWMPRALERLLASAGALGGARPRRELARAFAELCDTLRLGSPSIEEIAFALRAEGRGSAAGGLALAAMGEGAAAVRALREAAASIAEAAADVGLGEAPATIAELAVEIEHATAARGARRGGAAARAGAVRIALAGDLCALEHDLVVVTRLSASAYGGSGRDVDPLLDERLCAELPVVCRPAGPREREAWQRAELAWALAGARRVVLTRSAARDEDDLGPPHPLVRAALERSASHRSEPASRLAPGAAALSMRAAELRALAGGRRPDAETSARAAIERERLAFFLDPAAPGGPHTGGILESATAAREALRACVGGSSPLETVAVTAIERAAGCRFAGFAGRVLRIRRAEDVGEAAGARDRGTLVHRALEAAFVGSRALLHTGDAARILAAARAAAERALRLTPAAGPLAPPAPASLPPLRREALAQAVDDAVAAVSFALEHGAATPFLFAERRFGAARVAFGAHEDGWAALELPDADGDGGGSVFVDGQIDRVDCAVDRRLARVVDYKTGKLPSLDEHGKSVFQLPLYAAVVARELGVEAIDAVYVQIRSGGSILEHPREDLQRSLPAERAEALREARRRVLGLWAGDVTPRPRRDPLCARCDARDVCRRPAVMPVDDEPEERA